MHECIRNIRILSIFVTALLLLPARGQTEMATLDQLQGPVEAVATETNRHNPELAAEPSQPRIPASNGKKGESGHQLQRLSTFWIIAIVINISVVLAYFAWAIGQWRKQRARDQ